MAFSRIAFGKFLSEGAGNGIIPGQAHLVAWKKMHMQVLVFTLSGRVGYIQFVAFFLQAPVGLLSGSADDPYDFQRIALDT